MISMGHTCNGVMPKVTKHFLFLTEQESLCVFGNLKLFAFQLKFTRAVLFELRFWSFFDAETKAATCISRDKRVPEKVRWKRRR